MQYQTELQNTINDMVQKGRGILAADESSPTIAKHFKAIDVESTEESRRAWRSLLMTTPGLGEYISGIILFEETLGQETDDGKSIPEAAWAQKIVPGIKVDKGKVPLALSPGDLITQGLIIFPETVWLNPILIGLTLSWLLSILPACEWSHRQV